MTRGNIDDGYTQKRDFGLCWSGGGARLGEIDQVRGGEIFGKGKGRGLNEEQAAGGQGLPHCLGTGGKRAHVFPFEPQKIQITLCGRLPGGSPDKCLSRLRPVLLGDAQDNAGGVRYSKVRSQAGAELEGLN